MRILIIVVILVALGLGAYFLTQGVPGNMEEAESAAETATEEAVSEAEEAAGAAEGAAEEAVAAAEEAVEEATTAVEEAVDSAAETVGQAVESATEAVEGVAEDAGQVAGEAADAASDAAGSAVEAATDAANAVLDAATGATEATPALSDALTLDGFDFDTAISAIEGSDLSQASKRAATAALEGARDNPDLLPAALEQARRILSQSRNAFSTTYSAGLEFAPSVSPASSSMSLSSRLKARLPQIIARSFCGQSGVTPRSA
jgi:colicin import membrane protein